MKARNLREQTEAELGQLLSDTRKELFQIRVKRGAGDASEHPHRIRQLRRDIARMETVLRERQIAGGRS